MTVHKSPVHKARGEGRGGKRWMKRGIYSGAVTPQEFRSCTDYGLQVLLLSPRGIPVMESRSSPLVYHGHRVSDLKKHYAAVLYMPNEPWWLAGVFYLVSPNPRSSLDVAPRTNIMLRSAPPRPPLTSGIAFASQYCQPGIFPHYIWKSTAVALCPSLLQVSIKGCMHQVGAEPPGMERRKWLEDDRA
ncbi:hypothetical protein LX36DRAFT_662437 [Colletotrichum falcatum]|nr:hypothetical protein LX36DRAFT_662437 [Colletotrichum falcatum]